MRVLVTRPEPDGLKLKGLLEERGHNAEVEPLMQVDFDGCDPVDLDGVTALIATSRNALRALRNHPGLAEGRGIRVYAVGAATAEEARRLGFGMIVKGPGTVAALLPIIVSTLDPAEEMLLHLRGDQVTLDVRGELEAQGYRVDEAIVYRMRQAKELSESTREQIGSGEIEGVILMSPQSASIYVRLIQRHGLLPACRTITHLCLSAAIAERLRPLGNIPVEIAELPSVEELLALVDHAAAKFEL